MLFEIVNPSDACTLEAEDFEVACVACLLLGEGWYGLKPLDGGPEMPLLPFGTAEKFFVEKFGRGVEASADDLLTHKRPAVVACLESVLLGTEKDRKCYQEAMGAIKDDENRAKFVTMWHDSHRSSMNDIYRSAWDAARQLKAIQSAGTETEANPHG